MAVAGWTFTREMSRECLIRQMYVVIELQVLRDGKHGSVELYME